MLNKKKKPFEFYNIFLKYHSLTSIDVEWFVVGEPIGPPVLTSLFLEDSYNCLVMDFIFKWHCIVNEMIYLQASKFT